MRKHGRLRRNLVTLDPPSRPANWNPVVPSPGGSVELWWPALGSSVAQGGSDRFDEGAGAFEDLAAEVAEVELFIPGVFIDRAQLAEGKNCGNQAECKGARLKPASELCQGELEGFFVLAVEGSVSSAALKVGDRDGSGRDVVDAGHREPVDRSEVGDGDGVFGRGGLDLLERAGPAHLDLLQRSLR